LNRHDAMTIAAEIRAGLADVAAPSFAAVPISLLVGAIAASKGLTTAEVFLMCASVFAGGAQFAALAQWTDPVPIAAIAFGTLLINSRHLLMGISLRPKLGAFTHAQRLIGLFGLTDECWALAERRAASGRLTPAYWFALAVPLYATWVVFGTLGAVVGPQLGDPARLGADFAFTALFIGLVAGFWNGRISVATILASAATAALVEVTAGAPWHVPAGALAGIAAAYLAAEPEEVAA
jgi:4-azaleucine resistance transporter AzlC